MARGNDIVVSANPRGVFMEGYIGAGLTPKPGTWMQADPTIPLKGGRHTMKIFAPGADGKNASGPLYLLRPDHLIGKTVNDAYAAGDRAFFYTPVAGEELNCLVLNLAGTADDHPVGERMMIDNGTGMLIVTTGTPDNEPFLLLEAIVDPVVDTLAWVLYNGEG
jgi:hypothetical protein